MTSTEGGDDHGAPGCHGAHGTVLCGPCRAIGPSIEAVATEYKGRVKVAKLNVDDHPHVPQRYGIRSLPTLLLFKGGNVVGQIVGAVSRAKIEDAIKKQL